MPTVDLHWRSVLSDFTSNFIDFSFFSYKYSHLFHRNKSIIDSATCQLNLIAKDASELRKVSKVNSNQIATGVEKYLWSLALPYFITTSYGLTQFEPVSKPIRDRMIELEIWKEAGLGEYTREINGMQLSLLDTWAKKYQKTPLVL